MDSFKIIANIYTIYNSQVGGSAAGAVISPEHETLTWSPISGDEIIQGVAWRAS